MPESAARSASCAVANGRNLVFDRVLDGEDVALGAPEVGQRRIERGGLAGARRPGHEHDAARLAEDVPEERQVLAAEAELRQPPNQLLLFEDSNRDLLTERRGERGHAEIDTPSVDHLRDSTVLRQALFGDIEPCQHLETTHQSRVQLLRNRLP
jgi:hypothetical protein